MPVFLFCQGLTTCKQQQQQQIDSYVVKPRNIGM